VTYCSFDVAFLFYLSTQISTNIQDYGVFFDTGKLSDSGAEKRLRNGPFAGQCFARVLHALQRSAPGNLPGVACGVLKPSAEQQGVQEQRHDGVLGGPRCRKESRQPTHAAWSSALAACTIHQLHVEPPGFDKILPY
jgi:hypothetical protein